MTARYYAWVCAGVPRGPPLRSQAGTLAGLVQQCTTLPMEVIRTRLSVGAALNPPMVYKGIFDCARSIVATEGILSLCVHVPQTTAPRCPLGAGVQGHTQPLAHPPLHPGVRTHPVNACLCLCPRYKGFTATIVTGVPFVALQMTLFGVRSWARCL
jgi:hypothetical protein